MLHLLAQPTAEDLPLPYTEAVSRLASVRHALRLVDPFGAGPEPDACDAAIAGRWEQAGEAKRRLFERRSCRLIGTASAGIEALLIERQDGHQPHEAAGRALVEEIRRDLQDVAGIVLS